MAVPTLGKQEISENWLSQTWEEQKNSKATFSTADHPYNGRGSAAGEED